MIAVADSSPLVVLANTGYIHLAPALFTRVVIPPEVAVEMKLIDLAQAFDAVKRTDFWISPRFLDERLIRFQKRSRDQEPT